MTFLECSRCGAELSPAVVRQRCTCGGTLLARYAAEGTDLRAVRARPPGMWRYRELLPLEGDAVSLGEPETPLLPLSRLSERWGVEAWLKDDGILPTGTFKARGASMGVSRAAELGVKRVVMPTAGNAGGAWALYAARAGIEITVVMPRDSSPANRAEVETAGGRLVLVEGTLTDAARAAADLAPDAFSAATFAEPYRLEGKKTCWFEVFDQMGDTKSMRFPRTIVAPVGGGVGLVAAHKGAEEVAALGWADGDRPQLVGVQAAECAPIVRAFERDETAVAPWPSSAATIALGLRVPTPSEGALVLECVRATNGGMVAVTEGEIAAAVDELASAEGVFACPEGAAAVAGAARLARAGGLEGPVVVYNTGSGYKYGA